MGRPRKFDHEEAAIMYASGLSLREVAAMLGVSNPQVLKACREYGVPTRSMEEALMPFVRHGVARYRKGCRCEVCRAASAAQKRRQRVNSPGYRERQNSLRRANHQKAKAA